MQITIDKEFQQLLTPLSSDEYKQLESNVLAEGCRDPLVVWGGILLDGHNRYKICTEHAVGFSVKEIDLPSRDAAYNWIINNQLGRRNLTPEQASYLRGKRYNAEKRTDGGHGNQKSGYQNDTPIIDTASRLASEYGVSAPTIKRDAKFAQAVDTIAENVGDDARRAILASDTPLTKKDVIEIAELPAQDQAAVMEQKSKPHIAQATGDNEWYTPPEYIEAARLVMGGIDLDPASSAEANEVVEADVFYSANDDGLTMDWQGRVWMNPPYSTNLIKAFSSKLVESVLSHNVTTAIVLVNNATETGWFNEIIEVASAVCFPKGRVKFWHTSKETAAPLQGQAIIYIGEDVELFKLTFSKFGWIGVL